MTDPFDDQSPEARPRADDSPVLETVSPALWAMLTRPDVGTASTVPLCG